MADSCYSPNGSKRISIPNITKPSRASLSILKPLKARCPLQDLDLVPNTEDDTTTSTFSTMRRRRVSFAGVNKVKEFHTAAESLTVHNTPAYDEPFITTMSSDSSSHHHLTDSKIDGTGLDQMSHTGCIETNFSIGMDAVLDLTVKSTDNSSYKACDDIDAKENLTNNFYPRNQNSYYETDMECTTSRAANHLYYDTKNSSFANKSMEFTSVISHFSEQSNKSMMEFTNVIHAPLNYHQNESESKQYESMEFTQHVEGGIDVYDKDFENSFPSNDLEPNPEFDYRNQDASQTEFDADFVQSVQKPDIFTGQNLNNSKPEMVFHDAGLVNQVNSIFNFHKNAANCDFDDSNEMSFGMTGVVSQPLIECLKSGKNYELEIGSNESGNVSSFVESDGQDVGIECSNNPEGSEMEITELNPFSNPESIVHVSGNVETGIKPVFKNVLTKQPDQVLSFLRNYSGAEKNVFTPSHNLSLERSEAIKRSIEKQTISNSSDHHLGNIHSGDLSVSKNHSMEFTNVLSNNGKSNSCVNDTSVSKNHSMEFTNVLSNNVKSNSCVDDLSVSKNHSMEFTNMLSTNVKSNSCVDDLSVSKNYSMEFTNVLSNNVKSNSCVDDLSDSKNHSMEFTNALSNIIKSNSYVDDMSASQNHSMEFTNAVSNVNELSVSKNTSMEFTKAVSENVRYCDSNPSLTEELSKLVNVTSEGVFLKNVEPTNFESFNEKMSSVFETEEAVSGLMKENNGISKKVQDPLEIFSNDKPSAVFDTIDFNSTNVMTSTQEQKSVKNVPFAENVEKKPGTEFDTVNFNATNVLTSTQKLFEKVPLVEKPATEFDNVNFNATNVITSTQEKKSLENVSFVENAVDKLKTEFDIVNFNVTSVQTSTQKPVEKVPLVENFAENSGTKFETVSFNSVNVLTSTQKSFENVIEKPGTEFDTVNFNATNVITSTQEQKPLENVSSVENVLEKPGTEFHTINFNATNVITSTQEQMSLENVSSVENVVEKPGTEFDTVNFNATNVITSTQDLKSSYNVPVVTDERKSISVESFLSIDVPVETKVKGSSDFVGQTILAAEMELTKGLSCEVQSSDNNFSDNLSQPLNEIFEKQYPRNKSNSQMETSGNQPMDFTNINGFGKESNPDDNFENVDCFFNGTSHVRSVKDKRKSRRSELFVPLEKPLRSDNKMNMIEESEISNNSGSVNSGNNICGGNFSQTFAITEQHEDKMKCESLLTSKPMNVFNSGVAKSRSNNKSEISFDCAYKIDDSQMFTKSMLDQSSCEESPEPDLKSSNFECGATSVKTKNALFASMMKSFQTNEISLSHEFSATLNLSTKKDVFVSQSHSTKNDFFHDNNATEPNVDEDTQTFSRFMKAPADALRNSTIIKPRMNSTIMTNMFEESRFTLPLENISRSVFCNDNIDCPSFADKSEDIISKSTAHETNREHYENGGEPSALSSLDGHENVVENEASQEHTEDQKLIENDDVNEALLEKHVGADTKNNEFDSNSIENKPDSKNDEFDSNSIENEGSEEDKVDSNSCSESLAEEEITINEELLKNITIHRVKSRKSMRKSRCLTDLNDSITQKHDEKIKKIKISDESCNITGIEKLPDLTVNSAKLGPSEKSALLVDDAQMDVSISIGNLSLNDQNHSTALNSDHSDHGKLSGDNSEEKIVHSSHGLSLQNVPEIFISDHSESSKPSNVKLEEFTNKGLEETVKTPRSVLKNTQNFRSLVKNTIGTDSAPKQPVVNIEATKVYFYESSGPKKRGFVKKAASLYDSFVSNASPTSQPKISETNLGVCKRILDENYMKEKKIILKDYLEKVTPNANISGVTDIESVAKNNHDRSLKYVSFSPEDKFEKPNYVPSSSSNTSLIVHDDYDSNMSPAFKTPKSIKKVNVVSVAKCIDSPQTPKSPIRKRQRLSFISTPVIHLSHEDVQPEEPISESSFQQPAYTEESSPNSKSPSKTPSSKKLSPEFLERFEAETRPTKKEWNVLEANSALWSFEFLDGHLQLLVHFQQASFNTPTLVKNITFSSVHPDDRPVQIIGQNILLEKYPIHRLKSLCKSSSNVFDILHIIGNDAIFARKVMQSLDGMYQAVFTENSVMIELTSLDPNHLAEVTVDLTSWESLSSSSIFLENWIGNLRLPKIRSFFEECEKDHDCVRKFYYKLLDYIKNINGSKKCC